MIIFSNCDHYISLYEVSIRTGGARDSHRSNSKEF